MLSVFILSALVSGNSLVKYVTPPGHYLFINSTLHNIDEKAHLLTQPLLGDANEGGACKISMWYHMNGVGIGILTVYLQ